MEEGVAIERRSANAKVSIQRADANLGQRRDFAWKVRA
jgi:hypothetical protein